ncbi:OmpA family protein [Treponema sp.]|uniref:OmpA family protein n=1 Tax=Treponema sp. TaxID=166 RepID=UPI00298DFBD8|nr:OmpA family protein [Treponema sp.]MCR5614470.1 OmpA family protein [Treponema sp.]
MNTKKAIIVLFSLSLFSNVYADTNSTSQKTLLESTSKVNWITKEFKSYISLDIDKAQIPMPSGKSTASNKITTRLPDLIKDPLLTLNVDSSHKIGDLVLDQDLTYHDITQIISDANCTMGYFKKDSAVFTTNHTIALSKISTLLIRHTSPYRLQKPIEHVSSRVYTGIIIDARGTIPVHGEFIKDKASPCFFPRIFTDEMEVIYEKNMVDPALANTKGICQYDFSDDEKRYANIVGKNPIHILAQETFGENRSDIIIKKEDALKIICVPENLELLRQGKIVILLNKEQLVYDVAAPEKDAAYYTLLKKIQLYQPKEPLGPDNIEDGPDGIRFLYNLKFIPDSPELLPSERPRITECAELLKAALKENSYTIFVGGHTADIGQHQNQVLLSIERAKAIIKLLVQEGLPEDIFTYHGYGETVPAPGGDNSTSEGRAVNRRVEITLRPRQTYIQRAN